MTDVHVKVPFFLVLNVVVFEGCLSWPNCPGKNSTKIMIGMGHGVFIFIRYL